VVQLDEQFAKGGVGPQLRVAEHRVRLVEPPGVDQRLSELGQQRELVQVVRRHQRDRPPQEAARGVHVATGGGPPTGGCEPIRGTPADRAAVLGQRPQVGEAAVRLLEVVRRDLGKLHGALAAHGIDPVREPLVQLSARALEQAPVDGVADQ
jgi:hypothetical protein